MNKTPLAIGAAAVAGLVMLCSGIIGLPLAYFGGASPGCNALYDGSPLEDEGAGYKDWSGKQVAYAAAIVKQGQTDNIPAQGWLVALATVMQESSLNMYANENVPESEDYPNDGVKSDHNSVGLFQQQVPGWGTARELMDPAISSKKFYTALMDIDGWTTLTVTEAAQAVQQSAFPDAYADDEKPASELLEFITGNDIDELLGNTDDLCAPGKPGPKGWLAPVQAPLVSAFRSEERPDHYGVDLGAERDTPIYAATGGVVITAECQSSVGCDQDGSPEATGCGWYVQINHGIEFEEDSLYEGIATMYCHMESEPLVKPGEMVLAGQIIGYVGSTGNSSGPHLHYELHNSVPELAQCTDGNAFDPIEFHKGVKAPLGKTNDDDE